METMNDP